MMVGMEPLEDCPLVADRRSTNPGHLEDPTCPVYQHVAALSRIVSLSLALLTPPPSLALLTQPSFFRECLLSCPLQDQPTCY